MKSINLDEVVRLSQRVALAQVELETAKQALAAVLGTSGGAKTFAAATATKPTVSAAPAPAVQSSPSPEPVSDRVRKVLASGKPMTWAEVERGVLMLGPATKFAIRSAVQGERQKGRASFDGTHYVGVVGKEKPRRGRPPGSGKKAKVS